MIEFDGGKIDRSASKGEAPVLEILFEKEVAYPNGDKLPGVWITEPVEDGDGNRVGRTYVMTYPVPPFFDEYFPEADPDDADGDIALYYGGGYYDEGMTYADPADRERPVILGSVALRLAGCYEEGLGCAQDFARALEWYKRAIAGLEAAVDAGETWYAKALTGARAGAKRCAQETQM